jgi:glycosyltransferase involved in cell wall biosynthesis
MSRIAVLIPVHGNQTGLVRTLDSLRDQTFGSFDVVVVDDGSAERLIAPTQLGGGRLISVIRLETNHGIASALNHGLRYILAHRYAYIARLDAGDTMLPRRLEEQVHFLESNPQYAVVSSFVNFVDANGRTLFQYRPPCSASRIRRELHLNNCLIHPAAMIRASALNESGMYREDMPGVEDYELFLRLGKQYQLAILPHTLTCVEYSFNGLSVAGRRRQQLGRLKLQIRYFDGLSVHSFLGIARTLLALITPHIAVYRFKTQLLPKSR